MDSFNICKKCNYVCDAIRFQQNFENWTSGNDNIDSFIQDTQLSAHHLFYEVLEWISYDRLYNIKYITEKKIYRANWFDRNISYWNNENQNWSRINQNMIVTLKNLNDPKNIALELMNEINKPYGITQNPVTKFYMVVLSDKCKKCNFICHAIHFQQNFENWTSGNDNIDSFIQDTQLSAHHFLYEVLEWISYDRLYNIKYITEKKIYRANWFDGNISYWNNENQNWSRINQSMIVTLKNLNDPKNIALELMNVINKPYGITQNPVTKFYMVVLSDKCKKCNFICYAIHFQQNFENWTSGNNNIDNFIQDTQLSAHYYHYIGNRVLEWISYDRLYNIKYIAEKKIYRANWIDGNISDWIDETQNWKRVNQNMIVILKSLNNLKNITLELAYELKIDYEFYGITQNPETENYMVVLSNITCKECHCICNTIYFQQDFENWTSGNKDIDEFIRNAQLLTHRDLEVALEWIPYNRLYNIKYIAEKKIYRANWFDGNISYWNNENQNWSRINQSMIVTLKNLNDPKNIALELMNVINKPYGITQNPVTKFYMVVLSDKCKKCNFICHAIHFQQNFENWTSGNDNIDSFIQDTQLSAHHFLYEVLEWISYDRLYNIKYITEKKIYRANWFDGNISYWNNENQNWSRINQNMIVTLKNLNDPKNITLELMNEINKSCGITQNPKTKIYIMVLYDECKKCNYACNAICFQQNFVNWTSNNEIIDKFIQDTQLLAHGKEFGLFKKVLEWIPYDRLYDIKYIAKGGFGKVYRANWIDGYIINNESGCWNRYRYKENMFVALKSLNNSKNVTLEFINEITLHNRGKINNSFIIGFYGITQDPVTKNYMMVLDYAEEGSLRNYLDKEYDKLNWDEKIDHMYDVTNGLEHIHENELIHRDLHIGNILKLKFNIAITDMGLSPEVLRGQNYTKAADVYSFGIIMYEIISGLPPYYDSGHDKNLAIKICKGLRPRFNIKVPQLIVYLIKRCLDANSLNRPIAREIKDTLHEWQSQLAKLHKWRYGLAELRAQIQEANIINNSSSNNSTPSSSLGSSYKTHSEAVYTSRLLNFNNLPEPKNSDDYYEQNDNIISAEFSESLQIDISQLNIN
ncbi:kinase-like domain-containing protein [Rhizophagus clarus]|uniref:Kinase-like domain-containing protein n=1 Tax=Rhizophagus clarus TaxID=94130 RepID=A0A8H3R5J5_9GLOM|nr:kinase-like domain-containing protein [Rhizophagus clarus]